MPSLCIFINKYVQTDVVKVVRSVPRKMTNVTKIAEATSSPIDQKIGPPTNKPKNHTTASSRTKNTIPTPTIAPAIRFAKKRINPISKETSQWLINKRQEARNASLTPYSSITTYAAEYRKIKERMTANKPPRRNRKENSTWSTRLVVVTATNNPKPTTVTSAHSTTLFNIWRKNRRPKCRRPSFQAFSVLIWPLCGRLINVEIPEINAP